MSWTTQESGFHSR